MYQASIGGQIRSIDRLIARRTRWGGVTNALHRGRILKPWADANGYLTVYLHIDGDHVAWNVHRLVARTFLEGDGVGFDVNHIDGIKQNNDSRNLEWCTRKQNMAHARAIGLLPAMKAIKAIPICGGNSKIYESVKEAAKSLGVRNSNIVSAAKGRLKQAYGFRWEYITAAI